MLSKNILGNMAVQSWVDILKSSKKTALLNDGELFIYGIRLSLRIFWDLVLLNVILTLFKTISLRAGKRPLWLACNLN